MKSISLAPVKGKPNYKTYYFAAVLAGLILGIVTEDKYIAILVAVALVLAVAGMKRRNAHY